MQYFVSTPRGLDIFCRFMIVMQLLSITKLFELHLASSKKNLIRDRGLSINRLWQNLGDLRAFSQKKH